MENEGYELIPITSPDYSKILKENLKAAHAPTLLYIKGNKQILKENSIAIVGSRNATEKSLLFADNIAKLASQEYKIIVSGFAKGVDKQALDSSHQLQRTKHNCFTTRHYDIWNRFQEVLQADS